MSDELKPTRGRVMVVTASNRRRGAEVFASQLGPGLSDCGWEVDLVSLEGSEDRVAIDSEVLADDLKGRFDLRTAGALRKRVADRAPDVILAMGGSTLRYCVFAKGGTPLVYFAIGEPHYWIRSSRALRINRFLLRRTDWILAVSHMTASQLEEMEPNVKGSVSVAYTGVSLTGGDPTPPSQVGLRVLMVGSLSDEKDPLLGIESVLEVEGAVLRLVGTGPLEPAIREKVAALEIGDRVELVGAVEEVEEHYQWADVLLLTSRTEGLPGVIIEAAAHGVPAVGVQVGGVAEAIADGGIVVDRERASIARALYQLEQDPALVARLGSSARERVRREFSLEKAIDTFDRALREQSSL